MVRPDVLLVSLGTTLGWRVADRMLLAQLERGGAATQAVTVGRGATDRLRRGYPVNDLVEMYAATQAVTVGRGATDRLRRGYPVNDLVEMYAARRAVRTAVERHEPRALIVSSTTASMLLPSLPMPYAVRFDAPARLNRPGARNAPLRALERRAMSRARVTIPFSVAGGEALPEGAARPVVVSPPIDPSSDEPPAVRERVAVSYVSDPKAKGLDVLVAGWAEAAVEGARLEVYGLDPDWARSHLRRNGIEEPESLDLPGTVGAADFRAALRRGRVFVHGARWEDWGQAPLEALADGALLATVPAGGPYEGVRLARQLDESLVADQIDPTALAPAIRAAFELPDERVRAYREHAAELLRPYRSEAVQETVESELIPALLG